MSAEDNSYNLINLNNNNKINADDKSSMPYNLEAEQSFLGAILFDNTTLEKTVDLIKDYHLYEPLHKEIYQACLILFDNSKLDFAALKAMLVASAVLPMEGLPAKTIKSDLFKPPKNPFNLLKPVSTPGNFDPLL